MPHLAGYVLFADFVAAVGAGANFATVAERKWRNASVRMTMVIQVWKTSCPVIMACTPGILPSE